jgi:hypothetical protein
MSKDKKYEPFNYDHEYDGVGEAHDPEEVEVEDSDESVFPGFYAEEDIDLEKELADGELKFEEEE